MVKNQIASLVEKTVTTYIEAFLALLAASSTINISMAQTAAVAAIPAALTVVANGVSSINVSLPFYTDILFRTIRTYVVSFLGIIVAAPVFDFSVGALQAAAIGAIPAALAVIKGILAGRIGNGETPAMLPASMDSDPFLFGFLPAERGRGNRTTLAEAGEAFGVDIASIDIDDYADDNSEES
jgi:hypothetical protein